MTQASHRGRIARRTVLALSSRVGVLANRTLEAHTTLRGTPSRRTRRTLSHKGRGVTLTRRAFHTEFATHRTGTGETLDTLASFNRRRTSSTQLTDRSSHIRRATRQTTSTIGGSNYRRHFARRTRRTSLPTHRIGTLRTGHTTSLQSIGFVTRRAGLTELTRLGDGAFGTPRAHTTFHRTRTRRTSIASIRRTNVTKSSRTRAAGATYKRYFSWSTRRTDLSWLG